MATWLFENIICQIAKKVRIYFCRGNWDCIWIGARHFLQNCTCAAQSDQSLRRALCGQRRIQNVFKWTSKTLIRLIWVFAGRTCNLVGKSVPRRISYRMEYASWENSDQPIDPCSPVRNISVQVLREAWLPSGKRSMLKGKNLLPWGANSFLLA